MHGKEALLNLRIIRVGFHIPFGDIVADAQQQAKRLKVTTSALLSTL